MKTGIRKIWETFYHSTWISVKGIELDGIIDFFELELVKNMSWIESTNYTNAHLKSFTKGELFTTENNYVICVELSKNHILIFSKVLLEDNFAYLINEKLSSFSSVSQLFHIDVHSDWEFWSTAKQGKIESIVLRDGEEITIEGNLSDIENEFIKSNSYANWNFDSLLKRFTNITLSEEWMNKEFDKIVLVGKTNKHKNYNLKLDRKKFETKKLNIWNEADYTTSSSIDKLENEIDDLPF